MNKLILVDIFIHAILNESMILIVNGHEISSPDNVLQTLHPEACGVRLQHVLADITVQ